MGHYQGGMVLLTGERLSANEFGDGIDARN
jgi:hypothetical protein